MENIGLFFKPCNLRPFKGLKHVGLREEHNAAAGNEAASRALRAAVEDKDAAAVEKALAAGADPMAADRFGDTPLHAAARRGSAEICRLLIAAGAEVNTASSFGMQPLHYAAYSLKNEVVTLLLDKGADINARDGKGWTALMLMVDDGYSGMVKHLLEKKADPNLRQTDGTTALMMAASSGYTGAAKLFLAHGAAVDAQDNAGKTALMIAAGEREDEREDERDEAVDGKGQSPLMKALLDGGADIALKDKRGATAENYAQRAGQPKTAAFLKGLRTQKEERLVRQEQEARDKRTAEAAAVVERNTVLQQPLTPLKRFQLKK